MTFSRAHFSTLIKYIGVSFITGAISHWFFSGTRSLLTGAFGIFCFIVWTLLEEDTTNTWKTIIAGAILAVGIGSVTGGLQHFPDSPERSVLIVPIGYIISVLFFASIHKYTLTKKEYLYISLSSIFMLALSVGMFFLIENMGISWHTHDAPVQGQQNTETLTGAHVEQTTKTLDPEDVPWHHD